VVEASPWVEDNQWLLDLAARHTFIVGFCGHLNQPMIRLRRTWNGSLPTALFAHPD